MSRAINTLFALIWGGFFYAGLVAAIIDYRDDQPLRACAWGLLAIMNVGFIWGLLGDDDDAK